jgi:hypothetical protein
VAPDDEQLVVELVYQVPDTPGVLVCVHVGPRSPWKSATHRVP